MLFKVCFALLLLLCCSCGKVAKKSWHEKYGWNAETYFEDAGAVELCDAIERNDLGEMERLIASGIDVNAQGRGGMTPLMWAFPDDKFNRFELLLKYGADPSIKTTSDFGTNGKLQAGTTVAHESAMLKDKRYFLAVAAAGVSPNLTAKYGSAQRNLVEVMAMTIHQWRGGGIAERVRALLQSGKPSQEMLNTSVYAAATSGEFEVARMLFEAGAELENPYYYWGTPLHLVLSAPRSGRKGEQESYDRLMLWIEDQGVDIAAAQADVDAWLAAKQAAPIGSDGGHERRMRKRAKAEGKDVAF